MSEVRDINGSEGPSDADRREAAKAAAGTFKALPLFENPLTVLPICLGTTPGTQAMILGRHRHELQVPLTPQQKTGYNFLLAGLLKAEGLINYQLAQANVYAAVALLGQIHQNKHLVVLQSASFVPEWMETGIRTMKQVRSKGSSDLTDLAHAWSMMQKSDHLRAAREYDRSPKSFQKAGKKGVSDAFAIQLQSLRLLSQYEVREWMDGYGRTISKG